MVIRMVLDPYSSYFYYPEYNSYPEVGHEYVVTEHENIMTGYRTYKFRPDTTQGVPGNVDWNDKRFHGWRGTTSNIAVRALGVRRVLKMTEQKNGRTRIVLSDDLVPDLD